MTIFDKKLMKLAIAMTDYFDVPSKKINIKTPEHYLDMVLYNYLKLNDKRLKNDKT
jgi:hypothetical protein